MTGVKESYKGYECLCAYKEQGEPFAAPLLGDCPEDPDGAEPPGCQDKENYRYKNITHTVATVVAASGHDRVEPVSDAKETESDKLNEGGDGCLIGQFHTQSV